MNPGPHKFKSPPSLVCAEHVGDRTDEHGNVYALLCNRTPEHPIHRRRRWWRR